MKSKRKFQRDGKSLTYHLKKTFSSKSKAKSYAKSLGKSTYRIIKDGKQFGVYVWR